MTISYYFNKEYVRYHLIGMFCLAFLIRIITFGLYIQPQERYHQADSIDYHNCALSLGLGLGMKRIDTKQPIFWRTPGYPALLAPFYRYYGITNSDFSKNARAQQAAIWAQIIICSVLPLLVYYLAMVVTSSINIALLSGWLSTFHLGFVLASCYLLTDGLAQLLFILFMIFFFCSFRFLTENHRAHLSIPGSLLCSIFAALMLGLYTWMRPHGKFMVLVSIVIMLFGACSWRLKIGRVTLFCAAFFACIGPWYLRNYQLTNQWFFCPMSGPYLQAFCAPKILRRVTGKPLLECFHYILYQGQQLIDHEQERMKKESPHLAFSRELVVGSIAWPIIKAYPWYFMLEWSQEVIKTTFDLYASQLVAFASNTYTYDPLEEILTDKIACCLYKQPMHWFMRLLCWLEFIWTLIIWLGLIGGFSLFLIWPLVTRFKTQHAVVQLGCMWLKAGMLIGGMLIMTGGFGYARLRLPIEPLMIMLACTFYSFAFKQRSKNHKPRESFMVRFGFN